MKKLTIAILLAGQMLGAAQPAFAADFADAQAQRAGAFAGVRLRLPLDGPQRHQVRAGLALAPTLETRRMNGETRTRIGEGLEFGYRASRPLSFSLAGQDLSGRRFGAAQGNDDGHHDHTVRTVLLVVGGVIVVAGIATFVVFESILANEDS
jgi:hypothetical protein